MTPSMTRTLLIGVAALLAIALLAPGCCKPGDSSGWCRATASLEDCAKTEVPVVTQDVVNAALETAAGNWLGTLQQLEGLGGVAVLCAVKAAQQAYSVPVVHDGGPPDAGPSIAARMSPDAMVRAKASARANVYLSARAKATAAPTTR